MCTAHLKLLACLRQQEILVLPHKLVVMPACPRFYVSLKAGIHDGGAQEAPGLLQTIEDFMWFKLALVRPSHGDTTTFSGHSASSEFHDRCLSFLSMPTICILAQDMWMAPDRAILHSFLQSAWQFLPAVWNTPLMWPG